MEFTQINTNNNFPISETYSDFYQKIEFSPNKQWLASILNKRAVQGVPILSSFNANGLVCDFSSGLSQEEIPCIEEFLNCFFDMDNLLNDITLKNTQPIVESIEKNYMEYSSMFQLESYEPIEFVFALEQINTKNYNFFKCLQFALVLSKLEQMEMFLTSNYGPDVKLNIGELNAKPVSSFMDLYNFMVDKVRQIFKKLNATVPSTIWSRMQLNSHKHIAAMMWNVYSHEFAYLYKVESKYKIHEEKMEELFNKLCGYYTEQDESGKLIEKFTNPEHMEKYTQFIEIWSSAKNLFYKAMDSTESTGNLVKADYELIAANVHDQIIGNLNELNAGYASKYIPIMLNLEISMCTLLDATTNALDVVVSHLENQINQN